jgi:hypothetical protein
MGCHWTYDRRISFPFPFRKRLPVLSSSRASAGAMEGVFLNCLGELAPRVARPPLKLSDLDTRVLHLQSHAIEKSTIGGYSTGARDYIRFCQLHHIPLDPTPQTLSRYIAFTSLSIASGPKYLTGARHYLHELFPEFDLNRASPSVQATIRGSKKVRADPVRRKQPIRIQHLLSFVDSAIRTKNYDDLLFATIMSCCFYGCHRSGELVLKTKTDIDWRKVIKRSSFHFSPGYAGYRLPYHKSDPFYCGTDILFSTQEAADPVFLLKAFVHVRDSIHGARRALFLREDGSHPTQAWFDAKLFSFVDRSFGGHSARAGGATYYAALGLSESVIMALGRWSSKAWTIYIRDNPCVRAALQLAAIRFHH